MSAIDKILDRLERQIQKTELEAELKVKARKEADSYKEQFESVLTLLNEQEERAEEFRLDLVEKEKEIEKLNGQIFYYQIELSKRQSVEVTAFPELNKRNIAKPNISGDSDATVIEEEYKEDKLDSIDGLKTPD